MNKMTPKMGSAPKDPMGNRSMNTMKKSVATSANKGMSGGRMSPMEKASIKKMLPAKKSVPKMPMVTSIKKIVGVKKAGK